MITRRSSFLLPFAAGAATALSRLSPARAQGAGALQIIAADDSADALAAVNEAIAVAGSDAGRVRAVPGDSVSQTATQLANAAQPSAAVLAADVPSFLQPGVEQAQRAPSLQYIARLYYADLQIAARRGTASLADLSGRPVALGPRASQSHVAGSLLFSRLHIPIEPVHLDPAAAVRALLRGEVAAVVALARRPSSQFFHLNLADGVGFLRVPMRQGLLAGAVPSGILPEDYPMLSGGEAAAGTPVPTIAVPMLLAVSNWTPDTEPYRLLTQLTNALFQRASRLRGFDPSADVPGWTRFAPAAIKLGRVAPRVMAHEQAPRPTIKPPTPAAPAASVASKDGAMRPEERDQLFQEFLRWSRNQ